jgi:hypothetical protein
MPLTFQIQVTDMHSSSHSCNLNPFAGGLIVYGGSMPTSSRSVPSGSLPSFTVSSQQFYFDIESSYWMDSEAKLVVNNVYVNVHTENWPSEPAQRTISLPPLTEHSMISVRTVQKSVPLVIIVGGFSKYLSNGITPDHSSYNHNIYFSSSNGRKWQARGPHSRSALQPVGYSSSRWLPPRSAAAVFSYERMYSEDTLIFIHGGRHYNGMGWTNGGALDDLWFFVVEDCLFPAAGSNLTMLQYAKECIMVAVSTNPSVGMYFHSIIKVPVAGEDHFIIINTGFTRDGHSALIDLSNLQRHSFHVSYFTGSGLTLATFHPNELALIRLNIENDQVYQSQPPRFPPPPHDTNFYSERYIQSALAAAHYNRGMDVVFMFGGSEADFTRHAADDLLMLRQAPEAFILHQVLWMFKFDPNNIGKSTHRKLITLGDHPSKRAACFLISSGEQVILVGGVDASLQYRQDVFALSISSAHPSFTVQTSGPLANTYSTLLSVGSTFDIFVSASTIMKRPALSCESCFAASVRAFLNNAPSYNLYFSAAGIDANQGTALYRASFVPVASGKYDIDIVILGHTESKISYGVDMLPDVTCASTSRLTYNQVVAAGSTMNFLVSCFDAFHNRRPGGDIISATVSRVNVQSVAGGAILESVSDEFSYEYTDLKSGSHSLELAFTRSSRYTLASKLGMRMIGDQAFSFIVLPRAAHCDALPGTCNTLVIGQLDSAFAGQAKPM